MYIGGEFTESMSGRWMDRENPFSGKVWARVAQGSAEDAGRAVQAADQACTQGPWRQLTASQRGLLLHKMGDLILCEARNDMRTAQEEVFGPVLSIIRFRDEAHALKSANDVRFGLAAGVWTRDFPRAMRMAEGINAGSIWVNIDRQVSFQAPFGDYKDSGAGRENGSDGDKGDFEGATDAATIGRACLRSCKKQGLSRPDIIGLPKDWE